MLTSTVAVLSVVSLSLGTAAYRIRRMIEPCCPSCRERTWQTSSQALYCTGCGWTNIAVESAERQAA